MAGSAVADPRDLERVGTVLDEKWTLEKLLGSGGMGAVYAARHRNGARAAVKVLHPDLARVPEVRERFLREGYAANRVEHKGAVRVLDDDVVESGPAAGTTYLVMELLEGESLDERARKTPRLREREMLEVMEGVLDVLEIAHANGVIHRDLKPENLFLARDDEGRIRVKVLDFGLARVADTGQATNVGRALGTPSFMSPEQAAGDPDAIDQRTDIFALGSTLFQLTTGRRIHDADNVVALVLKMASLPAPPLKSVVPTASDAFAKIVDRALQFEKTDRYPDAASMRADVQAALELLADTPSSLGIVRAPAPSQLATTEVSASELEDAISADRALAGTEHAAPPYSRREAPPVASEKIRATAVPSEKIRATVPSEKIRATVPASERATAAPAARRATVPDTRRSAPESVPSAPWAQEVAHEEEGSAERAFFADPPAAAQTMPARDSSPPSEREESASTSSAPRERPRRSRLWVLVVTILGGIGVWLMWPDLKARLVGVSQYVPAELADAGASLFAAEQDASPGSRTSHVLSPEDAAATDAAATATDASAIELADDAADAGDDGGDEDAGDEEDDDEEDVDGAAPAVPAAVDAAAPRPPAAWTPPRPAARPAPKPAAIVKPRPPRKPGTGKRRRRRH